MFYLSFYLILARRAIARDAEPGIWYVFSIQQKFKSAVRASLVWHSGKSAPALPVAIPLQLLKAAELQRVLTGPSKGAQSPDPRRESWVVKPPELLRKGSGIKAVFSLSPLP